MKEFVKEIQRKEYKEIHIQLVPSAGQSPVNFAERVKDAVKDTDLRIVRATFFGDLLAKNDTIQQLENVLGGINFPYSWIEGENCTKSFINGAYFFGLTGIEVKRLYHDNIIVGSYFHNSEAEFCFLGGLCPENTRSPFQQTQDILESAENILETVGMDFKNTVRTWFYLDDILEWYTDFNAARTEFFTRHDLFNNRVPASTGIGGRNTNGSKICLELTAIKPIKKDFLIDSVNSPMQCSALKYGSSFSRAIIFGDNEHLNMTISGTASIDTEGNTRYINDIEKQIELTFKVVKEILESRNFTFSDITRAYAYFKEKSHVNGFSEFISKNITEKIPFICTRNEICRDDLLFEVDIDVIRTQPPPRVEKI